jgi:LuxR family transcriptional regulator
MAHAASHDLKFGAIVSAKNQMIGLRRSFLSCARSDREFTDEEIERIDEIFHEILALRALYAPLTTACHEVMTMLALGMSQIEIANRLGISRDTVKKRIERGRVSEVVEI